MHSVNTSKGPAVGVPIFEQIGVITMEHVPSKLFGYSDFKKLRHLSFLNTTQQSYIKQHNVEYQITQSAKEYQYDIVVFVRTTDPRVVTLGKLLFNG